MTQEEIKSRKEAADLKFKGCQKTIYAICPACGQTREDGLTDVPCDLVQCGTTVINSLDCAHVCGSCDNDCKETECLIKGGKK